MRYSLGLILISSLLSVNGPALASPNWRPVTPADATVTPESIGDANADAAILFRYGELNDNNAEGTSLKVYIRVKIFTERGRRFADVQLPYKQELGRITDLHARTVRPDGTAIEVDSRDVVDRVLLKTGRGIWRAKVFRLPAVEPGAIIEYRYRQTYPQGFRYFALDLQADLFTKEVHYKIQPRLRSRMDVRWVTFNAADAKQFTPNWDGAYNIKAENIPAYSREPLMPPEPTFKIWGWLYYTDESETDPTAYWKSYARKMYDRVGYEVRPTGAIRRVVESITLSKESQEESIARIYRYIQNEIQNIGHVNSVDGGVVTSNRFKRNHSAEDTIRRRYGTPGEINRLFVAMLRAAHIDARIASLTTRDENFFYYTFPDSYQFNSEIAAVIGRDGSVTFFDPGTPFCPLGIISWEKESVQALILGKKDWRFEETPISDAFVNGRRRDGAVALFGDGRVEMTVRSQVTGQPGLELRSQLANLTVEERRRKVADEVVDAVRAAVVDEATVAVSGLTDPSVPLEMVYRLSAPQVASRTETRLILRPAALVVDNEIELTAPERKNSVYFRYPWSNTDRLVIDVPGGFEVEQLPDPVEIDLGALRYHVSFSVHGEQVIYNRRLIVNAISFSVQQYASVRAFFEQVNQADKSIASFRLRRE